MFEVVPSINSSCVRLASCLQPGCLGRLHVGRFEDRRRLYSDNTPRIRPVYACFTNGKLASSVMSTPIQTGQDDPSGNLEEPVAPEDGQCTLYFGGSGSKLSGRMSTTGPESASNPIPETCTCTRFSSTALRMHASKMSLMRLRKPGTSSEKPNASVRDPRCHQQCARDEDHDVVRERARGELATVHLLLSAGQNRETLPPCQIRTHDAGEDEHERANGLLCRPRLDACWPPSGRAALPAPI